MSFSLITRRLRLRRSATCSNTADVKREGMASTSLDLARYEYNRSFEPGHPEDVSSRSPRHSKPSSQEASRVPKLCCTD